ncbi:MAG TPA: hypothetical protein VF989_15685, partial [Polyangiaceae bacterium]
RVRRLVDDAWEELQSPAAFDRPSALSVAPDGAVWVVEGGSGRLYRMNDGTSTHVPHPVGTGRAVWVGRDAVWLAGSGGAASFDGAVWRCAHGVEAVLDFVAGVESTIWLAGSSGVYRGEPAAPRAPASTRSPAD